MKPGLSLPSFPSVTRDSAPESQPVIWVSSWWQEMLTKMKADQPLLLKVNFSLSFQNHLGGWSQRKRAAPGRETCSGLLFSSVAFVRIAVTFSWAITSREHTLWMQSSHLSFGTFQPHSFPLHHVLGGELFKQMTAEMTKIVKSTQKESRKENMYSPGHLTSVFFPCFFFPNFFPSTFLSFRSNLLSNFKVQWHKTEASFQKQSSVHLLKSLSCQCYPWEKREAFTYT